MARNKKPEAASEMPTSGFRQAPVGACGIGCADQAWTDSRAAFSVLLGRMMADSFSASGM
ncbi:hypothetical protein GCM10027081_45730 [Cupriavidus yeoncheonensis]